MNKNVVVISTSLRTWGNSDTIANAFSKGATEAGHVVEKINLEGKTIGFCKGCLICQKTKKCILDDDMRLIAETVKNADILVFATPIYYYEMSGQMKTLLDRLNPLYSSDYKFREVYLIASAADSSLQATDIATKGLEGWISCFNQVKLSGVIKGLGLTDVNDINQNEKYLAEAYKMGKDI